MSATAKLPAITLSQDKQLALVMFLAAVNTAVLATASPDTFSHSPHATDLFLWAMVAGGISAILLMFRQGVVIAQALILFAFAFFPLFLNISSPTILGLAVLIIFLSLNIGKRLTEGIYALVYLTVSAVTNNLLCYTNLPIQAYWCIALTFYVLFGLSGEESEI